MTYHNAENYARGLLDELEGAELQERAETAADVRAELAAVSVELEAVNPDVLSASARDSWAGVRARVAAALAPEDAAAKTSGRKGPRTAAAASAPERAVPPAAK